MKYKIAICKTNMIGANVLILGICRYDDDDEFWMKYQMFTQEEYLNTRYTWRPNTEADPFTCGFKNQEECDKVSESMRKMAQEHSRYHGEVVHFDSINKDVKIYHDKHEFSLGLAEPVELTKNELSLLEKELNENIWEQFDWETWGK